MSNYIEKLFKYVYTPAITNEYTTTEYVCNDVCTTTYDVVYTPEVTGVSTSLNTDGYNVGVTGQSTVYSTTTCVPVCEYTQVTHSYTIPGYTTVINDIGWTAGAHSLFVLSHDDMYYFEPSADAAGIVTGLTTAEGNEGYTYRDIQYGFYISSGLFRVIESSEFKTNWAAFNEGDKFSIHYLSDRILYSVNDSLIHTTFVSLSSILIADISLYSSGDKLNNACVSGSFIINAQINTDSTLRASINLNGFRTLDATLVTGSTVTANMTMKQKLTASCIAGTSIGASLNINNLLTMTSTINGQSSIRVNLDGFTRINANMLPMGSISSGGLGNYTASNTSFSALESSSEEETLTPDLAIANTTMIGFATNMHVFTIIPIDMTTSFEPLDSISSEGPYAESITSMREMHSFSGEFPVYDGVMLGYVPDITINALGTTNSNANGVDGIVPGITSEVYTGAQSRVNTPGFSLNISGSMTVVGRVDLDIPGFSIDAYAYTGLNGRAYITSPGFSVYSISGATLEENTPGFSLNASGLMGSIINSEILVPGFTIETNINVEEYGIFEGLVPGFSSLSGIANLTFGQFTILATGYSESLPIPDTQVMNINNNALTEYTNFNFDNIIQLGDIYYGVTATGLYDLNGDLDDGTDISASFEPVPTDFGNIQKKNVPYLYITARTDSIFTVQSSYDEKLSKVYNSANMNRINPFNWRVRMARGLKAIYWGSIISNVNGSDFQIQSINNYENTSNRRR